MAAPQLTGSMQNWGAVGGTSFSTGSINWSSAGPNVVIVLAIALVAPNNTLVTVSSITDSTGLTWKKATGVSQVGITPGITSGPVAQDVEFWYAVSTASVPTTGQTITINSSSTVDTWAIIGALFTGANLSNPIDGGVTASATYNNATTATNPSVSGIHSNTSNVTLIAAAAAAGTGNNVTVSGWTFDGTANNGNFGRTQLTNPGTNYDILSVQGKYYTTQLTSSSASEGDSVKDWMLLTVGITADAQPIPRASGTLIG